MPTTPYDVTASAWVQVGTAPCVVETPSVGQVLLHVGTVAPDITSLAYHVLRPEDPDGFPVTAPGNNVYARSVTVSVRVEVSPIASPAGDTVVQSTATYRGGTITTGGASQQLMAANPARRGFTVQNQSTGDLYIKVGQTATTSNFSLRIAPGVLYETQSQHVSGGVVNITGATTGQTFYATEY